MKHRIAMLSSVLVLAACTDGSTSAADDVEQADRSYVSGNFMFNLQGVACGFVKSISGGGLTEEKVDSGTNSNVISLDLGNDISSPVVDWINASWKSDYQRKDGSIVAADFNLNAKSEREFFHALITETGIPAADGSSKDPAYIKLKFAPESVRFKAGDGARIAPPKDVDRKGFDPSNFRFEVSGMSTSKVNKIDAITIKQTTARDSDAGVKPVTVMPEVTVHLPESEVAGWSAWLDASRNGQGEEKSGSLVFLSSNREKELARVNFFGLGIFSITPDKAEANDDKVKRVSVRLRPGGMSLRMASAKPDAGTGR